jgi:hypothetical protein
MVENTPELGVEIMKGQVRTNPEKNLLDEQFFQLWQSFIASYGGLRLFSDQLPDIADKLDKQVIEEITDVMADIFGDSPEQVRGELCEFFPSLDNEHLYPDFYNQTNVRETFNAFQDTTFRRRVLKWERENPHKKHRFIAAWTDYMVQPPLSGLVLRQSALINLVSVLEILVDDIVKIHHNQIDPKRPFKDRPTWKDRWNTLQEIAPSSLWQIYRDPLQEFIARRNALVHKGGRITDDGYLYQTKEISSFRPQKAAESRFLLVPTAYLQVAFDMVILFALAFSQSAWRSWRKPRNSKIADKLASDCIYQILRQKRYSLVEILAEIAINLKPNWKYQQTMLTNWAIASREQSKMDNLLQILAALEKHKKRRWEIEIAIHILRQQTDEAQRLLKDAAFKGHLSKVSPYWPLFDPVREEPWFKILFAVSYGELPRSKKKQWLK